MIGIDIVKISRIGGLVSKFGDKFIQRMFTAYEITQSKKYRHHEIKINHFSKRFAAKEAYIKAVGSNAGINFNNIGIKNDKNGKPYFCINDQVASNVEVSLSDDGDYAIAMVMIKST